MDQPKWTVDWKVFIDGRDLTDRWRPVLIDIEVVDQAGSSSDTCSLTIDDTNGQTAMPKAGARLKVVLNGVSVFQGVIEQPQSSGSRSGGRVIKIKAKSVDSASKVKEPQSFHLDNGNLKDFLEKAAGEAGMAIDVDPAFASVRRDYWAADGESFLAMGERMAKRFGGTFKIRDDKAVLAKFGDGKGPGGKLLPGIAATFGKNLIGWTLSPRDPRRTFKAARAKWFDRKKARFETKALDIGAEDADAENVARYILADEDQAGEANDARKRESKREDGGGSIDIDIAVEARAEGVVVLSGAQASVDGPWRIVSVRHKANRSGGSTTSLAVKEPGAAGAAPSKSGSESPGGFALTRHETMG